MEDKVSDYCVYLLSISDYWKVGTFSNLPYAVISYDKNIEDVCMVKPKKGINKFQQ